GITRDKEYSLTKGKPDSKVLYFTANPNGEAEIIKVSLKPKPRLKKTNFDFDFSQLAIKGRNSQGNTLSKYMVRKIVKKEEGLSTLGAMDIWFDESVKRLNTEERGTYIGAFKGDDKILTIMQSGDYRLTGFDLSTHFDEDLIHIEKYDPRKVVTAVYYDGSQGFVYLKRFKIEESDKKMQFVNGHPDSKLIVFSMDYRPVLEVIFDDKKNEKELENENLEADDFISVKSYKAKGKRISKFAIKKIIWLDPLPFEPEDEPDIEPEDELENSVVAEIEVTEAEVIVPVEPITLHDSKKNQEEPAESVLPETEPPESIAPTDPKTAIKKPKHSTEDDSKQMKLF
nr:DNA gyrase/topoisomerase IV subunit A [Bacteroidota bacterium]